MGACGPEGGSAGAQDEMEPGRGADDVRELADLEGERRVLELLLHVAGGEPAEVAALLGRVAVGELARKVVDRLLAALDGGTPRLQLARRLGFGARLDLDAVGVAPRREPPRVFVLEQNVRRARCGIVVEKAGFVREERSIALSQSSASVCSNWSYVPGPTTGSVIGSNFLS